MSDTDSSSPSSESELVLSTMAVPSVERQIIGGSIFFRLPLELRIMIYRELLTECRPPHPNKGWSGFTPGVHGVHLAILRTCEAINQEATPIFYNSFVFCMSMTNATVRVPHEPYYLHGPFEFQGALIEVNLETPLPAQARIQAGIWANCQHLRQFHLHISHDDIVPAHSYPTAEALFRENLDAAHSLLRLVISRGGRIDLLRLDISTPPPGEGWIRDGDNNHDWVYKAVESTLSEFRGIKKVEVRQGVRMPLDGTGATRTPWTRAFETKMMTKTTDEDRDEETIQELLDMYRALERSAKLIGFLALPLSEARRAAEKGDVQGFLKERAYIVKEARLLFEEVERNLTWEPEAQRGTKRKRQELDEEQEEEHQPLWQNNWPTSSKGRIQL
ncbi:hypothetical protein V8F20_010791 [Naviculisporaceae sp. PSN 640]